MKKLFKLLLLLMFVGVIAAVVGSVISKKKFAAMSDDEIREFLAEKLNGRVGEDQLASIQDAVIAGVRARTGGASDHYIEDVEEAVEAFTELADEAELEAEDELEEELAEELVEEIVAEAIVEEEVVGVEEAEDDA